MFDNNKPFLDVNGVEHRPQPDESITRRISAYAVVVHKNKVLLVKEVWSDSYELPGGGIESGELVTDGVVRECEEEANVSITLTSRTPLHLHQSRFVYTKDDHKSFHNSLCLFFKAKPKAVEKEIANQAVWLPKAEIKNTPIQAMHLDVLKLTV